MVTELLSQSSCRSKRQQVSGSLTCCSFLVCEKLLRNSILHVKTRRAQSASNNLSAYTLAAWVLYLCRKYTPIVSVEFLHKMFNLSVNPRRIFTKLFKVPVCHYFWIPQNHWNSLVFCTDVHKLKVDQKNLEWNWSKIGMASLVMD